MQNKSKTAKLNSGRLMTLYFSATRVANLKTELDYFRLPVGYSNYFIDFNLVK